MNCLPILARCAASLACFLTCASLLHGADPLLPLRVVQVEYAAESQVDENPKLQEPRWVIRHCAGLKVISVLSGTVTDVLTHPTNRHRRLITDTSQLLTTDATVFGYPSSDDGGELTIARVADGSTIVHVNPAKIIEQLGHPKGATTTSLWGTQTFLANDASHLWCILHSARRIVRIDLAPEPHVAASQELKGNTRSAFNLFASRDKPGLVVATDYSPKGDLRLLRVFDHELRLLYSSKLPRCAAYCAVDRPEPLILLGFPQTTTWQLLRQQGKEFQPVSSAYYGPPRPDWNIDGHTMMDAAISPDGKLLVTSQASERPTICVWNPATGALLRQVELQGGGGYKLDVASHHTIYRLAFSKSGKYLTAADPTNAYLLDASQLVQPTSGNQAQ